MNISDRDRQGMMAMIDEKFTNMVKDADLTDSQVEAIDVLLTVKNWCSTNELQSMGANPASLINLVKRGIAERRILTSSNGFEFSEFRFSRDYYTEDGMLR